MSEFNYKQLDDIIHSRIRLAIMALLVSVESANFVFIREKVNTSDGNLSVHIRKLEDVKYVSSTKKFIDRKPVTTYRITALGRKAFEAYVKHVNELLNIQS
ncbi:MAG: transcriptional regulator [Candidatus Marinimicrobia bacterium]|nr:transcriptional regulator [Candidatus Neomarinimicrobiota bacterium]MBL7060075.1 transcriptional regulator [Candidatus Neomarinimicrobiota bacterium]